MKDGSSTLYDYVEGYFLLDQNRLDDINVFNGALGGVFAALPMEFLELEGISNGNQEVNPISKAGWLYGRNYLNRLVYSSGDDLSTDNFEGIIEGIFDAFEGMVEIIEGPNGFLENKDVANKFKSNKSWIRLLNPEGRKYGGGCRVTGIRLHDQWDAMTQNDGQERYLQFYGQEYDYNLEDGTTSGVASFEPNASKENPYVEPFYSSSGNGYRDKIVAPRESNYVERPIGASFFPSPTVTYSRVTVRNLEREREVTQSDGSQETVFLKKHATGKVVTEHFTCKDFPTISKFTEPDARRDNPTALSQLFKFNVQNHITMSQGFVVETNDMNGKMKRQQVFAEDKESPISGVEYFYNTMPDNPGQLNNMLTTIDDNGNVETELIGMDYEVVNDFREHKTNTETGGVNGNLTTFLLALFPGIAIVPLPTLAKHENQLRTATTMKHIHKNGIMIEKRAFDLGSNVSTKNLAWDSETGQVLLTKTINEYDDNYFNFTYPVHWYDGYKGMGQAAQNIDMEGDMEAEGDSPYFAISPFHTDAQANARLHLTEGDEILLYADDEELEEGDEDLNGNRYWVAGFHTNDVMFMDREGKILNECGDEPGPYEFRVVRSGFRNQQSASMASVTSMINPIDINDNGVTNDLVPVTFMYEGSGTNPRIINASAVEYKDFWLPQTEYSLARFIVSEDDDDNLYIDNTIQYSNPYLYNVKAEWRALKSYAYLTGRNFNQDEDAPGASPRREGFFRQFQPYYQLNSGDWSIDNTNWTFASEVAQYSPYGAELENMDALGRFSAAQYGYNYTLPTAVSSNSRYSEIGFDGFEDYNYANPSPTTVTSDEEIGEQPNRDHFSFRSGNIPVTSESHTGRRSLIVVGEGNEQVLERHLLIDELDERVTCVELPDDDIPICNPQEFLIRKCPNEAPTSLLTMGDLNIDFGNDGPADENPVTNFTYSDMNSFEDENEIGINVSSQGVLIAFGDFTTEDLYNIPLRFDFEIEDGNGTVIPCFFLIQIIEHPIPAPCDEDGNPNTQ